MTRTDALSQYRRARAAASHARSVVTVALVSDYSTVAQIVTAAESARLAERHVLATLGHCRALGLAP